MSTTIEERKATIKELVCDILELDAEEVTDASLFKEDHGADSLRAIEILAALEKSFGVTIDQTELGRMENLTGVYQVVSDAASWES